jgi:hypothetical protein
MYYQEIWAKLINMGRANRSWFGSSEGIMSTEMGRGSKHGPSQVIIPPNMGQATKIQAEGRNIANGNKDGPSQAIWAEPRNNFKKYGARGEMRAEPSNIPSEHGPSQEILVEQ